MITDLTQGNVRTKLWLFSIPMLLSVAFQQMYHIVDSIIAVTGAFHDLFPLTDNRIRTVIVNGGQLHHPGGKTVGILTEFQGRLRWLRGLGGDRVSGGVDHSTGGAGEELVKEAI